MFAASTIAFGNLSYVECSNGFQSNPVLEGGRTELEFADINNDGNVDILSIGDHGSPHVNTEEHGVMVWFGDGAGNWSVFQYGDFGYGGIAVGDVNNDSNWDVGYGMHHAYSSNDLGDQLLEVALGDGTGQMWTPWDDSLMPGGSCWGMFATDFGDIDNDGLLDVASVSFGSGVGLRVYRNLGNGSWGQTFATPGSTNSNMECYLRDVNRDGNLDAIAALGLGSVWLGDGTGGFVPANTGLPTSHSGLAGISPGDADNDGGCDVSFANSDGGVEVYVWNNQVQSWEEFSGSLPDTGDFNATELCDMDADGFMDVCAIGGGLLKVWTGDGTGNWTEATTISTSASGYYEAFRTGGDIDHNGFPDLAFVAKEGTWSSYRNVAHAFRETSPAESLNIFPVFPRGGERFVGGSVQFIDWWSEAPNAESTWVRLELSTQGQTGPWQLFADSLRNSGRYQWLVPRGTVSADCFIRYTVSGPSSAVSIVTPRAFIIGEPTGLCEERVPGFQGSMGPVGFMSVVPNPARDQVVVEFGPLVTGPGRLVLYDAIGRQVRTWHWQSKGRRAMALGLEYLAAGPYFLRLETNKGTEVRRLVKEK